MTVSKQSSVLGSKQFLLVLTGLIVVYQCVNQVFMMRALALEGAQDECPIVADGRAEVAPHCQELQLFQSWQQADRRLTVTALPGTTTPPEEAHLLHLQFEEDRRALLAKHIEEEESLLSAATLPTPEDSSVGDVHAQWALELDQLRDHLARNDTHAAVQTLNASDLTKSSESSASQSTSAPNPAAGADLTEVHKARDARRAKLMADLQDKTAEYEAGLAQIAQKHSEWERNFAKEVQQAQIEMCQAPYRRNRPDCIELLASVALEAGDNASNASEASVGAVRAEAQEPPISMMSFRHGHALLRWPTAWTGNGWLPTIRSDRNASLRRSELDTYRWAGAMPKVACIASFTSGPGAAENLYSFLSKFYVQTYEGHAQLVIVYHNTDEEAGRLINLYASTPGSNVVGVSMQDNGTFPSVTALRYGAWSQREEAQVIFQWDMEVEHDQHRISSQVRALARTARPASLLKDSTFLSLAGEAKWMDRFWRPEVDQQTAMQEHLREGHVVDVDLES